ncbi:MAG: MATE family efflux transporter [Eubacteriales bacterium]|nr:MATE family efflux transporter [Eubacteriales bacterium]
MKQTTQRQENKMGIMPVPKLLITMSLPMMLSMLVQACYNIVDSIFVSHIGGSGSIMGEHALTAVSLAFPMQNLMMAVATGTGVGINALLSRSLGEKNEKDASLAANNGIFLALISYLVFAVIGIFFSHMFFAVQTDNSEIIDFGTQYMSIVLIFSFGVFMQVTCERLLQSTGKTIYNMITQGVGAITNIILDPILIFGLFGVPKMGVAGAAIATVAGQILAMFLGIFFNIKVNTEIHISMKGFRPCKRIIRQIYAVGIPSIIMVAIGSVMTFGFNKILLMFTSTATAVFGVYFKLNSFVFMPVFGLNNGMIPIIAYNYGARNKERITQTIRLSIMIAIGLMMIGLLAFELIPDKLLLLFNASENMLEIGVPALRIIALSFLFAGFCIVVGSVFQALGNGVYSLIISVARQLIVLLPVAFILAHTLGLSYVWWSYDIAEIMSLTLSALLLKRIYREKLQDM